MCEEEQLQKGHTMIPGILAEQQYNVPRRIPVSCELYSDDEDELEFDEQVIQLQPGDRLYMYSDGVPEAMDAELEEFGETRMLETIQHGRSQDLDASVSTMLTAVERWCEKNGPKDDVSILGLEVGT